MLIALISICTPSDEENAPPRGLLRFAGQSIAERQMDLAARLGCGRFVGMVDGIGSEVIELQGFANDLGCKFHAVTGAMSLLGQVSTADELYVFAEGVLPQADAVENHLGERSGVLVLPADGAVDEGYERIDAEWAWAGVLRARGSVVEGLSQLPPDIDPVSALLRISLQRGARVIPLDGSKARRSGWLLARSDAAMAEQESEFLHRFAERSSFWLPLRAIGDRIALRMAVSALDRGRTGLPLNLAGLALGAGGLAAGWYERPVIGLLLRALGAFVSTTGMTLSATVQAIRQKRLRFKWFEQGILVLFDVFFVVLAVFAASEGMPIDYGVLALLLVGLLHLAREIPRWRWTSFLRDRPLAYALLAIAAGAGVLKPAMAVSCLAIVALLVAALRRLRLTPA